MADEVDMQVDKPTTTGAEKVEVDVPSVEEKAPAREETTEKNTEASNGKAGDDKDSKGGADSNEKSDKMDTESKGAYFGHRKLSSPLTNSPRRGFVHPS
jgi:hypothetical protein